MPCSELAYYVESSSTLPPHPWVHPMAEKEERKESNGGIYFNSCCLLYHLPYMAFIPKVLLVPVAAEAPAISSQHQAAPPSSGISFLYITCFLGSPTCHISMPELNGKPLVEHPPFRWILLGRKRMSFGQNMQQGLAGPGFRPSFRKPNYGRHSLAYHGQGLEASY